MTQNQNPEKDPLGISDEDVIQAMGDIHGYLDITPSDFKAVYQAAYAHALSRMRHSVKARDIMTCPVHVVARNTSLAQAARILAERKISGLPVVDDEGKVVGVVSEKDFLKNMGSEAGESFMEIIANCLNNKGCVAAPVRAKTAGDIMSQPALTAPEDLSVADMASLFMERKINRLPVVDGNNQPLGIVARSDLVKAFSRLGIWEK